MFPIRDHNPSQGTPILTYLLIAINVAIFVWQTATIQTDAALYGLYDAYALVPLEISQGQDLTTLVTSTFLHGGFSTSWEHAVPVHLRRQPGGGAGRVGFLAFYLPGRDRRGAHAVGGEPLSPIPTIGASGRSRR
jgi:hypothetical protein